MSDDDDITRNKHKGNPESEEAFERTKHRKQNDFAKIHAYLHPFGLPGKTADEVDIELWGGVLIQTVSARFSEMKRDKWIVATGERRPTRTGSPAAVCCTKKVWDDYQASLAPPPPPDPPPLPPAEAPIEADGQLSLFAGGP